MKEATAEIIKAWFNQYVNTFLTQEEITNQNILIKKEHSLNVGHEMIEIGRSLGLSESDLNLAEIIGLFHDIGRFEQYKQYGTFVDSKSENHALLGVKVLKTGRVLEKLDSITQALIFFAISNHNRFEIEKRESEQSHFFTRLLRDADKIDIWRVVTDYYYSDPDKRNNAIELDLPDHPEISETVCEDLLSRRMVKLHDLKTLNDFKLLQIGWIYDLHFKQSFLIVQERDYLKLLFNALPQKEIVRKIYSAATEYLNEKLSE